MNIRIIWMMVLFGVLAVGALWAVPHQALAQNEIECGTIIENELTKKNEWVTYRIDFDPGYQTTITLRTRGETFSTRLLVKDPTGLNCTTAGCCGEK
jgi:hypothetical protein